MDTLLMQPSEVPVGAVVLPCLPGQDEPDTEAPLRLLFGGVPMRAKWYPCDLEGNNLSAGCDYAKIADGIRFAPAQAYSTANAPLGQQFAAFVDGVRIKYEQYPHRHVEVTKLLDGTFMSVCGVAYDHWLRRYQLPDGAVLVAYSTCNRNATTDDAVKLPELYEGDDVWKMFREAGAKFMRGYPKHGDPQFFWVWLPPGWKLAPHERRFTSATFQVVVDDAGVGRALATCAKLGGRMGGA